MPPWRQKAVELFPELDSRRLEEADTPYLLWFMLREAFERAYESTPRDESMIKRVYQYSDWCISQPQGETAKDDLATCAAVCFFEHIPQHPGARADMPRWFTLEDVLTMKQIFTYHLSETEYEDLRRFFEQHQNMYVDRGLKPHG